MSSVFYCFTSRLSNFSTLQSLLLANMTATLVPCRPLHPFSIKGKVKRLAILTFRRVPFGLSSSSRNLCFAFVIAANSFEVVIE